MERFEFNTAISALMELSNAIGDYLAEGGGDATAARGCYAVLLQLLHPFAPHITEELWDALGHKQFILVSKWPIADPSLMQEDVISIVVQVNGKLRDHMEVPNPPAEEEVLAAVRHDARGSAV